MLSLFPVACSKFGASSLKAEVSATDVNTLISAALLATAANKHDINPPAAISAMRFANDVWIMHPSHEINFSYSITSSTRPSSVMRGSRPLLCGGLRRRLPRDEFPAVRRFCPGVEDHELQAARLAVDFSLDRRAAGDECGIARQAHLAIAASRVLVFRLSRPEGGEPGIFGVGEPRGVGIEKLVVEHRLERGEIAAAHSRVALVLEGEDFLVAAHRQTSLAISSFASSLPRFHSITSSAIATSVGGTLKPRAFAVLRLMTNSNLVACITGRSAGFSPLRMRPV